MLFPNLCLSDDSLQVKTKRLNLYHKGNDFYQRGNYESAISSYKEILDTGLKSSEVYYNLANSYFRNSNLGEAIFHYNMSSRLAPNDADTLFNLNYARSKTVDKIEENKPFLSLFFSSFPVFSEKLTYILLGSFSAMACLFSILLVFLRAPATLDWIKWLQRMAFVGVFYFGISLVKLEFFAAPFGVVIKETKVYSAAGKNNVTLFTLHEGAEFRLVEKLENGDSKRWIRLELKDGKQGWVSEEKVMISENQDI